MKSENSNESIWHHLIHIYNLQPQRIPTKQSWKLREVGTHTAHTAGFWRQSIYNVLSQLYYLPTSQQCSPIVFSEMLYSLEWDLKRHAKSVFKIQYASLRLILSLWPLQYCLHNYIAVGLAVLSGDSILFDWVPETHPMFTPGLASIKYEQRNTL